MVYLFIVYHVYRVNYKYLSALSLLYMPQELVKMIKVKDDTYDRLTKRYSKYGETMNDIIKELLDIAESKKK